MSNARDLADNAVSVDVTTYRQALRDLPTHENWPHLSSTDWPIKP